MNQQLGLCALALFILGVGLFDTPLKDEDDEAARVDVLLFIALAFLLMAVWA